MSTYDFLMGEAKKEGYKEGFAIGLKKGELLLEQQIDKKFVTSLINATDFDDAKIAILVGVSAQFVLDLRDVLKK